MAVRYNNLETTPVPRYVCQLEGIKQEHWICQSIPGKSIDQAISELLLKVVTPLALEITLAVQCELQPRRTEADG